MKKVNVRKKSFLIRKSRIPHAKKHPRPLPRRQHHERQVSRLEAVLDSHTYRYRVPPSFSVTKSHKETMIFLGEIKKSLRSLQKDETLFIDFSQTKYLGIAALLYLLDMLATEKAKCKVMISEPIDSAPKKRMQKSGLKDFIANHSELPREWHEGSSAVYSITVGEKLRGDIAGSVCEWVRSKHCDLKQEDTEPIYEMLVEMMKNSIHHSGKEAVMNVWYLYAEQKRDIFDFIFFDTGMGIAKTVRKKSENEF